MNSGPLRHFVLVLRLNLRSLQALIYGYAVPLLFLLAFGAVFRDDTPALRHEMGQIFVITILGGACFGLPTGLVAERERGVWRRYRLLPTPTAVLVLGTLAARLVIVASALAMQAALAHAVFGTPWPVHPLQTAAAALAVTTSFLGLGLLIAALANDVPAVQALGQCLFLPMILVGGVGVPLSVLPDFAQRIAGFMPGRYAVHALQQAYASAPGLRGTGFDFLVLAVIGTAAALAGSLLFRWEAGHRIPRAARLWVPVALGSWLVVGSVAGITGRLRPLPTTGDDFAAVTAADIAGMDYSDLPGDQELAGRLDPPFTTLEQNARIAPFVARLRAWSPGTGDDSPQAVRSLVCVAAVADISADPREGRIARAVYDCLLSRFPRDFLARALAWVALYPHDGHVYNTIPALGLDRRPAPDLVRSRCVVYAKKYLGRIEGKLHD
ncbi:ABC-2 type transporter [mine drainage metagenome]|uniref:ABC-2 type transporter n=1 Tax=mine drainage metagenome TaxID=410659 RepID=A0A1J5SD78_9ZZZZ